jgi:hypothetical protein
MIASPAMQAMALVNCTTAMDGGSAENAGADFGVQATG